MVALTEWTDIPAAWKPTLRIQYEGIDTTFTSDAIYGRRLTLTSNGTNHAVLALEGATVATSTNPVTPGTPGSVDFSITHNAYATTSADHDFTQSITAGGTYLIGNSWGPAGRGPLQLHRTRFDEATAAGAAASSELVLGSILAVLSSRWIAQNSRMIFIHDRMGGTTSTIHHLVGIAGHDEAPYVDLPGNLVSITSQFDDIAAEDAVFFSEGMHGSIIESTAVEQTSGVSALSTAKLIDQAVAGGLRIYDANAVNYAGTVAPDLVACAGYLASFQAAVSGGSRLLLPSRCDLTENDWTGAGWFDISADLSAIGSLISGDLAGGFASTPQPVNQLAMVMILPTPDNITAGMADDTAKIGDPIDLTRGHYLYDNVDIATGVGRFPLSLALERQYNSAARITAGSLGKGWTHGFEISAADGVDGLQSMGEDSALDAVATIAEFMVALDLLKDVNKPLDKLLVATVGQRWFGDQLLGNIVIVRQGLGGAVFVKLPDGSYNPPPDNPDKLIKNGDGTYSLEMPHKAMLNFNAAGRAATHVYPTGVEVRFTYSGNDLVQVQNSLGRTLTLTHAGGRLINVSDGTRSVSYTHDAPTGNLTGFTDAAGQATTFEYDLPGRLTRLFYPGNPLVPFVTNNYDSLGRVETQANALAQLYSYYFAGVRSEEVAPDGSSKAWYLDGFGRVVKAIDALGRVTSHVYDAQSRLLKTTLPEGNSVEYDYDDAPCVAQGRCTHNVKTIRFVPKPASGLATLTANLVYESAFNKLSALTDPRGKTTNTSYDAQGNVQQILLPPDPGGTRPQDDFTYTSFTPAGFPAFSLLTKVTSLVALGDAVERTVGYDAMNRYAPQTFVTDAGAGKLNLATTHVYDAVGNLTQVDGPRSDVVDTTTMAYDAERRPTQATDALGRQTRRAYDADGRLVRTALQAGAQWLVSCRTYTPSGKVLKSWGPALTAADTACPPAGAPVPVVDFAYDNLDRLQQSTENLTVGEGGNRVSQLVYTLDGRVQTVRTAVGTGLAQDEAARTYTQNGLAATVTDARNNRTTYEYDGLDRKRKTFYPDKLTPNASSATDFEQFDYDANSNITAIRKRNGQTIAFAYDNLNRMTSRTYPAAADNVNVGYDLLGRVLFANHADSSHDVSFAWDHAHRLAATTAGGRSISHLYDPAGNRIRTTWPEAPPFYVTNEYDALNRPTAIRELGATTLATYGYDDLSRRTAIAFGNATATSFGYDAQGMLASLAHDLGGAAQDVAFSFGRNQAQEITSLVTSNPLYEWNGAATGNVAFAANGLNQYTSVGGAGQAYDANGNLTGTGTWSYTYDTENRLRTAAGPVPGSLAWDGLGRLRRTTIAGAATQLLYDGARLIAEYDGGGTLLRRYVHGSTADEPLVRYEGPGTGGKSWHYADHQHSIVATADAGGTSTATLNYGPFGESGTTSPGRFGYTGQQFLGGLDLYHYKARAYAPARGRFLQTDPIGMRGGMNLYAYVRNDPLNHRDPTGLWTIQIGLSGSGVFGFIVPQGAGGIAIDGQGNIGIYGSAGGGLGLGLEAGTGFQGVFSPDASTIYDLSGGANNASVHGGIGWGGSLDYSLGSGQQDQPVHSVGFTVGPAFGAAGSYTRTWTQICGVYGADQRCAGPLSDIKQAAYDLLWGPPGKRIWK
ncbi:MAG: RHS repeat-associated core domain-containing protein [Betaproteobacteria bacterium]|nr:RHS repeat-associated core domain-containing protein [Betaproteobacteria bacterium]